MFKNLTMKLNNFLGDVIVLFLCHFSILLSQRVHGPVLTATFGAALKVGQVDARLQTEAFLQIVTQITNTSSNKLLSDTDGPTVHNLHTIDNRKLGRQLAGATAAQ
jgi:hypothetical protein